MSNLISSGSEVLDFILGGGLEKDVVTTIYGPSGSGKTNLCIVAIANVAKDDKKVLFLDTEGGFSVERIKQIDDNYENILKNVETLW